ncbi:hypothetical protein SCHPADRAFT_883109 [Schizopora paradoxa]|uniref:BTB domain-containing protein n=1 Tax=Schizopora paradoxa TaxID=27342 RepID=A0A0H2R455_9AGAM|nr:hypothetical protein SCHPADRAFT_883109 [Schizopora paradoxa]
MESQRSHKRRKGSDPGIVAPQQHEILWFPDGNIVLSTDVYLFKLYKGLLSMKSSVFRDMFDLVDAGAGRDDDDMVQEMYDGVPLVTLVGDRGEDVVHLMRAVFEHDFYHRDDKNTPLDVVTALLVLSTKYDFRELRKEVVMQISQQYPMSLKDFDYIDRYEAPLFGRPQSECDITLLKGAYNAGVDALLPILFLHCASQSMVSILCEVNSMNPECLCILLKGREKLGTRVDQFLMDLPERLQETSKVCKSSNADICKKGHYIELSLLARSYYRHTQFDLLYDFLHSECKSCATSVEKQVNKNRKEIWEEIPSYFGYPGWDDAKAKLKELIAS